MKKLNRKILAYWGKKTKGGLRFSITSLKTVMNHLIENYYLNAENVTMKQAIGTLNHFLYSYEEEYMPSLIYSDKIKARHFHSTKHLIGDLYAINDGREFGRSINVIYAKELKVKMRIRVIMQCFRIWI